MKKFLTLGLPALAAALLRASAAVAQITDNATAADIRDIRGPLSIPYPWLVPVCVAGGLALAAAAGFAGWRWYRRRSVRTRMLSAHERAFEQLERARALMQEGRAYAFSCAVSDALREYVERRFELRATCATTEEFLRGISGSPAGGLSGFAGLLEDFLTHCDLAKFARFELTIDNMQVLYERARQFVETTKITEEKTIQSRRRRFRRTGKGPADAAAADGTRARTP